MKTMATIAMTTVLACGLPAVAHAQAQKGDREIQVSGNVQSLLSQGTSETSGTFRFGVGFFLTDRLEVGATPSITISKSGGSFGGDVIGSSVNTDGGLDTFIQYAFGAKSSKVKPYVGGSFIINSFKTDEFHTFADNTFAGATVGVKNYLTEKAALDFQGVFGFRPNAPGDFQLLGFNIGITYIF